MAELSAGYIWLLAAGLVCLALFVILSPEAQRGIGIWLIARADASEKARSHFAARRAELQAAFGGKK